MSRFIVKPNLPEKKVKKIICGTEDERILSFFKREHIERVSITPNLKIDPSLALHADVSALHLGNNKIIVDTQQADLIKKLTSIGMDVYTTVSPIAGVYPGDVVLNFAICGNSIIGNFKYADGNLYRLSEAKKRINVRQGYTKCSMLIVDEDAVITDDESIHKKMTAFGKDSLLVSKGDVMLRGHAYGFIGGASFKISHDTVAFFGDITKHRDYFAIKTFAEKYGCRIISTDDGALRDIGGAVSITEE